MSLGIQILHSPMSGGAIYRQWPPSLDGSPAAGDFTRADSPSAWVTNLRYP